MSAAAHDIAEGLESIDVRAYINEPRRIADHGEYDQSVKEPVFEENTTAVLQPPVKQEHQTDTVISSDTRLHDQTFESSSDSGTDTPSYFESRTTAHNISSLKYRDTVNKKKTDVQNFVPSDSLDRGADEQRNDDSSLPEEPAGISEPAAPSAAPSIVNGDLKLTPVWMLLADILKSGKTGRLVLMSRNIKRFVLFEAGQPIVVLSSAREDRLVDLLYREGRISRQQYDSASLTIGASGRRAGVVMVDKGIIPSRELFPVVRHHYESILFDCFSWTYGEWSFETDDLRIKEKIQMDVPVQWIIVEGMRTKAAAESIDSIVPPQSIVTFKGDIAALSELIDCSPEDSEMLEWCNGDNSTDYIAKRFNVDEFEFRAFLAGIVILGYASCIAGDDRHDDNNSFKSVDERSKAGSSTPLYDGDSARFAQNMVESKFEEVIEGTYFAILEVSPEALPHEIHSAYSRLKENFNPQKFLDSDMKELHSKLEIITSVIEEANEVLSDTEIKELYRSALLH
jgi:hypothetical protein